MTRSRRLGAALAIVMTMFAGTGCAVIPVGGPFPMEGAGGGEELSKPFQRMIAVPPQRDWDPVQVVKGLQAAMAAYADDPTVLPAYLTPEAARAWRPDGPVTVIGNAPQFSYESKAGGKEVVIKLVGTPVARIEADDTYVPASSAAQEMEIYFTLVRDQQGAYKVKTIGSGLGLLLTVDDLERAYRPTNLYFLAGPPAAGGVMPDRRLVVDRVWLRLRPTENFAQTIVRRLLGGPSKALHGAVGSVFPQGMSVRSVRSGDDRVVVDLAGPIDPEGVFADGLKAQLKWSLNSNNMANGRTIEVQLDGEPFFSSDSLTVPANWREEWLDNTVKPAYFTSRGAVYSLNKDEPGNAVQGPAGQPSEHRDMAMAESGDLVAARGRDGVGGIWVTRIAPDGQWEQWIQGARLTAPSWRRDGTLWTYDLANAAVIRCDPAAGRGPERVAAPGLDGLDVTSLRVARDGVRVAVTIGDSEVRVGAITGGAGAPMLGNFQTLTTVVDERITDIAWLDGERLLVLVQSKDEKVQSVREINIGDGETTQLPTGKRLKSITALRAGSAGDRILAATEDSNEILEFSKDKQAWSRLVTADQGKPFFPLG
ncbi:LpqB family beta-propeller domain-containing protein [Nonomuraea lactucae]|uniref:LpqB family beta-propeller domain-containing protein n=1 Tax=Nonomuraea lactucae TaxID=2249762 RepID=UPI0013B3FDEE|nr:LpqB family beta-propeller domain-containing protein [Nonomuraea lactucae]